MPKQWDPFGEFKKFQGTINKKIDFIFSGYKKPFSNIRHNQDSVFIDIKLPEIDKKNILLETDFAKIIVMATKKIENGNEKYYRVLYLPPGLDVERAKAKFSDDFLNITIPKKKARKRIQIK